jgi:hypothetical protein
MPCFVLQSIRRTPLWASPIPRCFHSRSSSLAVEITSIGPVRNAANPAPGTGFFTRTLHDLGDPVGGRPREIRLTYSQHHCTRCRHYFTADMSDLAAPKARYTHRVVALAVRLVVEDGLPYQTASWHLWRDHRVFVPFATIQNWVEAGGKKGGRSNPGRLPRLGPRRLLRVHRRRRVVRRPLLRPVDRR